MLHPEFPIASFLSLPLLLLPLPCYIRSRSISIVSLAAWLAVMNIIRGVDSIAWAGNVDIKLQVWCDITTKINLGFTIAVPLSALCLMQRLESIASGRHTTYRGNDRRRQIIETIVCFGLPMIFMALSYVVQGHRFDITEDFGCSPAVYFSVAAMFILWIPPLVVSLTSFVFSALTVRHFLRHRIAFSTHLGKTQSGVNASHYFRLMALGITDMFWSTGVNSYVLWYNLTGGLRPWISWENVHSNFSRIALYPTILIPQVNINQSIAQFWITPISSLLFFLLLGLGREAIADYRAAWMWFRRTILMQQMKDEGPATILPSYKPRIPQPYQPPSKIPSIVAVAPSNETRVYNLPLPVPNNPPSATFISSRANSVISDSFHFDRLAAIDNPEKSVAKDGIGNEFVIPSTESPRSSFASERNSRYSINEIVELDISSSDEPELIQDTKS